MSDDIVRFESFDLDAEAIVEEEWPDGTHVIVAHLDARHLPSVLLLIVELEALHDDMRVGASPFADRLGHAIERLAAGSDEPPEDES